MSSPTYYDSMKQNFNNAYTYTGDSLNTLKNKTGEYYTRFRDGFRGATGFGGRHRTKKYRGGNFHASSPTNGIATHASPINGIRTASAHYVGGKRRSGKRRSVKCKRRHRHTSRCRR